MPTLEDVDLSWRANNAGYKNLLCPTAKCYHICGASTGAVKYNAFKSQQSGRNSILLPLKNEPLLMLILNFIRWPWATCSSATSSTNRALARHGTRGCTKPLPC